jgi:two-component system, cell cycle sensor histidine kinase and response regulator CckA
MLFEDLQIENEKLKKLLSDNNIPFEKELPISYQPDIFEKAKFISKLAYWRYSYVDNQLVSTEEAFKILEIKQVDVKLTPELILSFLHYDDRDGFISRWEDKLGSETVFDIETRIIVPDGSIKFIVIKVFVEKDKNQKPIFLHGTVADNTEKHYETGNLYDQEEMFRNLFNNLTDIFIIFEVVKDAGGNIVDYIYRNVNPTYEMKLGLIRKEIIDRKLSSQAQFFQQFHPLFQVTLIAGQPQQDRLYIQSLDSFFDVLIYSPSENILATIWRDVTLMVESESSLRESEEKYRQIFSIGSDALFMIDFNSGRILDVNPSGCKMFGFSREELLRMLFNQLSAIPEKIDQEIKLQRLLVSNHFALKTGGVKFPVEITFSYFNWSGRKVSVASVRDISERIESQDELIRSEQKFKQLFDYSNDAILVIKNYRIIDFNQKSTSLFILSPEALMNKTLWNLSPVKQPDDNESRTRAVELLQNSLLGNQLQFEWIFEKEDKSTFVADVKLSPIMVGSERVVQAIIRDISPQKEFQVHLKQREELWKHALDVSSIGVWEWNIITNEVYFSNVWKKMLGYEKNEIQNDFDEFEKKVHPDDLPFIFKSIDDYLSSKIASFAIDFRMRCKNGTYKWIHSNAKIISFNSEGKPERFIGTHIDITKQRVREDKLIAEIRKLNYAANISQLGYWELDLRTMVISGNKPMFELFGFENTESLSLRQLEKIVHSEDKGIFMSQFEYQPSIAAIERVFRVTAGKNTRHILSKCNAIKNDNNVLVGYKGSFIDISEIKQDNTKIIEELNLYKTTSVKLQTAFWLVDDEDVFFVSDKVTELTGYTPKEIISRKISPLMLTVSEDKLKLKTLSDSLLSNTLKDEKIDIRIETKNNRVKWVEVKMSSFIFQDTQKVIYVLNDITQQKINYDNISDKEKELRNIVNEAKVGIAMVSSEGLIIFTNGAFNTLSGYAGKEIKNKKIEIVFSEPDSITISKAMESMNLSLSVNFSKEFQLKGVDAHWVNLVIIPFVDQKNVVNFIFYIESIDARKRAENDYNFNSATQKLLIDNTTTAMALISNKFEVIKCNHLFSTHFQIQDAGIGKNYLSDSQFFESHLSQIQHHAIKVMVPYNFNIKTADNKTFSLTANPVDFQGAKSFVICAEDISETKIKTDLLSQQLERYEGIFNGASVGIFLLDKNRNITFSNPAFSRILKYPITELSFKKIDTLIDTKFLGESLSKFSQLFTGISQQFRQTLKMATAENENIWVDFVVSPMLDMFGDTRYAIVFAEDVTDAKDEEIQILANERLLTLNSIANSFAHEFNNLLMGIYGNAYVLKSQIKDGRLGIYVNDLMNSANRATNLTHKMLSLSGKNSLVNVVCEIYGILKDSLSIVDPIKNIKINKIFGNKEEILFGDPFQLQRVFENVLQNAIDAMPDGGSITIETSNVFFDTKVAFNIGLIEKGKYLRINITDDGIGISNEDINRIFDPFFTTKTGQNYNSGLGLTIAKQIITQHGGAIKANSVLGNGTTLSIYIPIKPIDKTILSNQPSEKMIIKGSANILLVDDEDVVRLITSELLSDLGYDVYSFSTGKTAIQFFKSNGHTIDLVILDKQMPEMDGFEVYKKLKEIKPSLKVILLTGYNIEKEFNELFDHDTCRFIQKPVSIEKISYTISELLYRV